MLTTTKTLLAPLLILVLLAPASANFPEMTPTSLEFQDLEPGEQVETTIYLDESLERNVTVDINPTMDSVSSSTLFTQNYDNHERISEQPSEDWWSFEVFPLSNNNSYSPPGSGETFRGKVDITLDIPEDAQPGLRYGKFSFEPEVQSGGEGDTGGQVGFAFSPNLPYSFDVNGEVRRQIMVQDVRGFRLGEDQAAVELLLNNRGTVTSSTKDIEFDVIDSSRNLEGTLIADSATLQPQESQWVDATWQSEQGIEEGSYQIDGSVEYFTGESTASGSFTLPGFNVVEVRPEDSPANTDGEDRNDIPLWLVFMVLLVMAVLMWSFDIEPFWITAIIGGLGISAFILLSSVSNILVLILIMMAGIIVYGVS